MKTNFRVLAEKLFHGFGFMRREVIENDMDLSSPARFVHERGQKFDELIAGVPLGRFAFHLSGFHVQCRIKRQRAVAIVLKTMSFGTTWGQRQNRIQPIERLNCSLLIDAENGSVLRWV